MRNGFRRTPSLQHVITLMRPTVEATKRELELLERANPGFNYLPFDDLAKPLMEGSLTEAQALSQCAVLKNAKARGPNADLVSAFARYSKDRQTTWFNNFTKDFFPIAPGVAIPVNPTGFWMRDGKLTVMWVQKWKGRTLDELQRAIFHSVLDRRVFVGDDFGSADLEWVDLKAPKLKAARELHVLNRKAFGLLSDVELKSYTDILLEAFRQFDAERTARREDERAKRTPAEMPLFAFNSEQNEG